MTPETRELLSALRKVNQEIPALALGLMDGSVSVARQVAFAEVWEAAGRPCGVMRGNSGRS